MNAHATRKEEVYYARLSSFHEASHLVVARELGGDGWIRITPRLDAGPEDRPFAGQCHFSTVPTDVEAMRMIGIAGVIAECLLDDIETCADKVEYYIEMEDIEMSASDMKFAEGFTFGTIERTVALLRRSWSKVQEAAGWEIAKLIDDPAHADLVINASVVEEQVGVLVEASSRPYGRPILESVSAISEEAGVREGAKGSPNVA